MKIIPVCHYDLNEVGRTILEKLERKDVRCTKDDLLELGFIFNEKLEIEETNGWVIVRTERLNIPFLKKLIEHMPHNVRVRWEHLNTAELTLEEKPPLKLRVGGVYKRRDGKIEKIKQILYLHALSVRYESENEFLYHIDGRYYLTEESSCDLIEEVQPKYVYTVAPDENLPHVHPLIPLSELPSWEELESLRKENTFLKRMNKDIIALARCLPQKPESNPFKVGDKAIGYSLGSPYGDIVKGTVSEIDGDKILIDQEDYPDDYNCNYWFHYKQCELVRDKIPND